MTTAGLIRRSVPEELLPYEQFVIWRMQSRNGKLAKVPHNPWTGYAASVGEPGPLGAGPRGATSRNHERLRRHRLRVHGR